MRKEYTPQICIYMEAVFKTLMLLDRDWKVYEFELKHNRFKKSQTEGKIITVVINISSACVQWVQWQCWGWGTPMTWLPVSQTFCTNKFPNILLSVSSYCFSMIQLPSLENKIKSYRILQEINVVNHNFTRKMWRQGRRNN